MNIVFLDSDNLVRVDELKNSATDTYVNSATVTFTLYEEDGTTEVTGQVWPTTGNYVASSNGRYHGTLTSDLSLNKNTRYKLKVIVDGGAGLKKTLWKHVRAQEAQTE